jgi:hypothetical protein
VCAVEFTSERTEVHIVRILFLEILLTKPVNKNPSLLVAYSGLAVRSCGNAILFNSPNNRNALLRYFQFNSLFQFAESIVERPITDIAQKRHKSKAVPLPPCRQQGERIYNSYSFLNSALDGVSGQCQAPAALYPLERTPVSHWTGGWVGPRAGLDTEAGGKILCLCRVRTMVAQYVVRDCID